MRIVVVEDEKRARTAIRNLLAAVEPLTQIVGECENAWEGMAVIRSKLPDLAFVDIRMPRMSGLEMIRQLRQEKLKTEFVIITGYSEFQYAKEGIDLGVVGYILKPVTYEDIEQVLMKAMARRTEKTKEPDAGTLISLVDMQGLEESCQNLLVRKALHYIREHISVPCRLAQTARDLMVSPEHLSRVFHEETHMTFTDYVRLVKIDYAKILLRKTSVKVSEVSWMIGIENEKYFHNIFKETVGMTPREYRMLEQE